MKTIAILETHMGGHHLMYLRVISKTLLGLGHQVIVYYPQVTSIADWLAAECPELLHRFQAISIPELQPTQIPVLGKLPQPLNVLARWQSAAAIAQTAHLAFGKTPDLFFFSWLDDLLSAYLPHLLIDQVFPYPWAGICFQPRLPFQTGDQQSGWFDEHEVLNAKYCCGCGVLDNDMMSQLQQRVRHPVTLFPDFTDESPPDLNFPWAEQLKQLAQGRKIIALVGSLNRRKGLLTLVDAALQLHSEPYFFAFIGELSIYTLSLEDQARIKAIASAPPSNCFFRLERIPEEPQFNALVSASDVLFAAYENFPYSSNILTKAAVFQKPVIVSDRFCMGKRVQQYQMGRAIDEGSIEHCITAIREICQIPLSPNFAGYHQCHSIAQLQSALQEMLSHV
jgi:glycosyltransferase involved in cell wall biosynthesis